jgi:non-heme chloroperoxidase
VSATRPDRLGLSSPEGRRIRVEDAELYFESYGTGPALLLVPGAMDNILHWSLNVPGLVAAGYRVIVMSLRGHFMSPCSDASSHFRHHADDLEAIVAAADLKRVAILASSFGGFGALRFALRRPSVVSGLVLSGSTAGVFSPVLYDGNVKAVEGFERALAAGTPPWVDLSPSARPQAFLYRQLAQLGADSRGLSCPIEALLSMKDRSAWLEKSDLASFGVPTLIIGGDRETLLPPGFQRELVRLIPSARLSPWVDTGHVPFWEDPRRYNLETLKFLGEIGYGPGAQSCCGASG